MDYILTNWPLWFICLAMIVAAVIDGWKLKVPNWLTFPLVLSGWALGLCHNCGLLGSTEGTARVGGFDINTDSEKVKASIGYMSQKFSLYEDLTVEENIMLPVWARRIRRSIWMRPAIPSMWAASRSTAPMRRSRTRVRRLSAAVTLTLQCSRTRAGTTH